MRLVLGMPVHGPEAELGVLADVVVDTASRSITHLVVEPRHHPALARLVPVELALHDDGRDAITLRCSPERFHDLPEIHEVAYGRLYDFPVEDPRWGVGITEVLAPAPGAIPELAGEPGLTPPAAISYDRIPRGEAELRRKSLVLTADGSVIGRVTEVVAADDNRMTHLVLRRPWWRWPRRLTLPADAVARVENDAITLRLTKRDLDPPGR